MKPLTLVTALIVAIPLLLFTDAFSFPEANAQAVWNGRTYSGRVCSNPTCRMCNSIQSQLSSQRRVVEPQQQQIPDSVRFVNDTPQPEVEYVTTYRTETRQVPKYCNGRVCGFITQTVQVPVRVPVTKPAPASTPVATADPDFIPTPEAMVREMVALVAPQPTDVLYDLGCGDGRILRHAIDYYGSQVLGIEYNASTAALARKNLKDLDRWRIVEGDATKYSLADADVVTIYLYPETIEQLKLDTLKPGARVVSYQHDLPGLPTEEHRVGNHRFYTYTVPHPRFKATPPSTISALVSNNAHPNDADWIREGIEQTNKNIRNEDLNRRMMKYFSDMYLKDDQD